MITSGSLAVLRPWVGALLILEMIIDLSCLAASIYWFIKNNSRYDRLPLRLGTAAAFFHALRVLVFVLGRSAWLHNFDVRPEHHASHSETWTWFGVYFASIMSILGVLGVLLIWRIRVRARRRQMNAT
jgi:hypothetical protein